MVKQIGVTALIAIARKVVISWFEKARSMYILATDAVVLSLGFVDYLVDQKGFRAVKIRAGKRT